MRYKAILTVLVVSLLTGFSSLLADPGIQRGIDVFTTLGNGKTYYDFSQNPIPAGFFCKGSKTFTGKVTFKGLPLATDPPGLLGSVDTVLERLDDAAFDDGGVAVTRLRLRALSLVSIAPVKTSCGAFHVYISLDGEQRVTPMRIVRTQEGGGEFAAPIAVDARIRFVPVKRARTRSTRALEVTASFNFPALSSPWSFAAAAPKSAGAVTVDTNGDLIPDALLPGTSNFFAGQSPDRFVIPKATCSCCPQETCHYESGKQHCSSTTGCPGTLSCC